MHGAAAGQAQGLEQGEAGGNLGAGGEVGEEDLERAGGFDRDGRALALLLLGGGGGLEGGGDNGWEKGGTDGFHNVRGIADDDCFSPNVGCEGIADQKWIGEDSCFRRGSIEEGVTGCGVGKFGGGKRTVIKL